MKGGDLLLVIGAGIAGAGVLITLAGIVADMVATPAHHEGVAAKQDDGGSGTLTQIANWLTRLLGKQIKDFVGKEGEGQPLRAFGVILLLLGVLVLVIGAVGSALTG